MLKVEITSGGVTSDISHTLLTLRHESEMNNGAARLKFTVLKTEGLSFFEGDSVKAHYKGKCFFAGRIFTKSRDDFYVVEVLAYDSMRYLKNRDTLIFRNKTASKIIAEIVEGEGLALGKIESTPHVIESLVAENRTYLDIMYDALRRNLIATSELYTLYEDGGSICLAKTEHLESGVKIDSEMLNGLSYSSSIDSGTANHIKIFKEGQDLSKPQSIVRTDDENTLKWGKLSYFYEADPLDTLGVINAKADQMLKAFNKIYRKLEIQSEGDISCIAGWVVHVNLPLDSIVDKPFIIERAVHTFEKGTHFMSLTLSTNNFEKEKS